MSQPNQTVTVKVSEDSGLAIFSVAVDGVQEGVFSTTADNNTNQTDSITITGDFGPTGPHEVDVTFLNDQSANLFVHSVDVNGHVVLGSSGQYTANPNPFVDSHDPNDLPMPIDGTAAFNTTGSTPTGPAGGAVVAHDFNADGTSDLLTRDSSGNVSLLLMHNGDVTAEQFVNNEPDPAWHMIGTADFRATGNTDVLWEKDDGTVDVWTMNGTSLLTSTTVAHITDPGWHYLGTGDFNGDGKTDVLWENDDGSVGIWKMNGAAIGGTSNPATITDPGWHYLGAGDLAGNGTSDILWQNTDGTVGVWMMNGGAIQSALDPAVVRDPGWHFAGVGDFNGDGKADLLWQNDDGTLGIWQMNGGTVAKFMDVTGFTAAADQHVVSVGHYQSNAIADIVLQDGSGQLSLVTLDQNEHATVSTIHTSTTDLHLV